MKWKGNLRKNLRTGFGLLRNYGWKKNLLAVAAGYLCCLAMDKLTLISLNSQFVARFDLSVAILPLSGFLLGIWGVLGCLLRFAVSIALTIKSYGNFTLAEYLPFLSYLIPMFLYSALPSVLWYATPLKGEEQASYPRLDTSAHVIKYYIIMTVTLVVYVLSDFIFYDLSLTRDVLLAEMSLFTQCLDMVLIVSMPCIILISMIRNRTITINERMVLAFLFVGVIASILTAFLVYRTAVQLRPELFKEYNRLFKLDFTELTDNDYETLYKFNVFWNWYLILLAVLQNVLLIVEILFMRSIERKVTRPILNLSGALENYTSQGDGSLNPEKLRQECLPYTSGFGEVGSLTQTCVNMAGKISAYTRKLEQVTAEKQRIGTELDIASNIQRDMLPTIFPPFPDRGEIELYASMQPAKEVGGDFYDYYFIDHDHLALTIADVSGKGVPAALFMVISMTLLHNHAALGGSPKEILTYVNHQLCQNNKSMMFCTVWLGILDLKTGRLTASNAGHEYPAIRRNGGQYELMMNQHDPAIGIRDGLRYHEYDLTLSPGDMLFQYTDGVTEATDTSLELFGEERMLDALNQSPDSDPETVIRRMHDAIDVFVKEATQFDDITMLCFKYKGAGEGDGQKRAVLTVTADENRLNEVTQFLEQELEQIDCPVEEMYNLTLAAEEIFVNIARYAYEGREGDVEMSFSFDPDTREAELVFSDSGIPFDPTRLPAPDTALMPGQRRIGGLGIHLVRKMMDEVQYEYQSGKNLLTVRRRI